MEETPWMFGAPLTLLGASVEVPMLAMQGEVMDSEGSIALRELQHST